MARKELAECTACGHECYVRARTCPNCGKRKPTKGRNITSLSGVLLTISGFAVLAVVVGLTRENGPRDPATLPQTTAERGTTVPDVATAASEAAWDRCAADLVERHRADCRPDCEWPDDYRTVLNAVARDCGGSDVRPGGGQRLIELWQEAARREEAVPTATRSSFERRAQATAASILQVGAEVREMAVRTNRIANALTGLDRLPNEDQDLVRLNVSLLEGQREEVAAIGSAMMELGRWAESRTEQEARSAFPELEDQAGRLERRWSAAREIVEPATTRLENLLGIE